MQYKSLLVVAAAAATVSAQSAIPIVGGALKGLHILPGRDIIPVMGGALRGLHVAVGGQPAKRQAEDEPYVPEWSPGETVVEEAPESPAPQAPAAPVAPTSSPVAPAPKAQATSSVPTPAPPAPAPQSSSPAAPAVSSTSVVPNHAQDTGSVAPAPPSTPSPSTTPAPAVPSVPAVAGQKGALTFNIVNKMGGSITISYQLGTYSPPTGGAATVASELVGMGSATTGTFSTSTQVVAPVGWAGRMTIGKGGAPLDFRGTKIEGNNGFDGADPNADPDPDVDVSYVDGYSVPATCSCGGVVLTGCNKELFDLGNKCGNLAGDSAHPVCVNDPRDIHGPASGFFAPCAKAAYTYDYDDVANWQGTCAGNVVDCCIGTDCAAPTRQPAGNSKREVMVLMGARKRAENARLSE